MVLLVGTEDDFLFADGGKLYRDFELYKDYGRDIVKVKYHRSGIWVLTEDSKLFFNQGVFRQTGVIDFDLFYGDLVLLLDNNTLETPFGDPINVRAHTVSFRGQNIVCLNKDTGIATLYNKWTLLRNRSISGCKEAYYLSNWLLYTKDNADNSYLDGKPLFCFNNIYSDVVNYLLRVSPCWLISDQGLISLPLEAGEFAISNNKTKLAYTLPDYSMYEVQQL